MVTCTGFSCGSGKTLKASPDTITCSSSVCTPQECCIDSTPLTCVGYDCTGKTKALHASPSTVTCSGSACTETECCTVTRSTIPAWGVTLQTDNETNKTNIATLRVDIDKIISDHRPFWERWFDSDEGFENKNNNLFFMIAIGILLYLILTNRIKI
tara:strand:+ start:1796 stop:2263 length:468 start_codon:yes stop_codon:yes gene_type:complete